MSSGAQERRAAALGKLTRELRQFQGLSASFFRAAAARIGMTVTDTQVLEILESAGPATAGQLADLTGLTTGAITGMINRLEEAGLVRRERDATDGRRVIVRLAPDTGTRRALGPLFVSLETAWAELAAHYDDEQLALLLEFLTRSNALSRTEIMRLREAPTGDDGLSTAPLGNLESARLVVASGQASLTVRADAPPTALYQAHFTGPMPDVSAKEGLVTVRYPKRLIALGGGHRTAEIILNSTIPWRIAIQGHGTMVTAKLDGLILAALDVTGGGSSIHLELPTPSGVVPIRINGAASEVTIRRPAGVAARVHLQGFASMLVFDDQQVSGMGRGVWLQSASYNMADPSYDFEVKGATSMVTITSG